nr:hypothetical protein [bacterium]
PPLPPEGYFVSLWPRLRERLPRGTAVERPRFAPVRRPVVALAAASLLLAVMVYYFSPGAGIGSFPGAPASEIPAAYVIARPDGDGSAELERDYVLALPASEPAGNFVLARATSGAGAEYW